MKKKLIYLACDYEDGLAIVSSDSLEGIKNSLDEYCGVETNSAKFNRFSDENSNAEYLGYFEYNCCEFDWNKTYTSRFKIYCLDFYPSTKKTPIEMEVGTS